MLQKFAVYEVIEARLAAKGDVLMRTSHKHSFQYDPRPGFLYVRSRAISSRTNDNFDNFPAEEIAKGYRTFVGKPVFVNHHNDNHRRARGVIIDAALHEDRNPDGSADTWVEVLMEVDAVKFPKLAKAILAGEVERTSMGTDVEYSLCSVCGNKAATPLDYCKHIPKMKGMKVKRVAASGQSEEVLVYERCFGLRFFENSLLVEEPADPTAYFLGVDDRGLSMAASRKRASETEMEPCKAGCGKPGEWHVLRTTKWDSIAGYATHTGEFFAPYRINHVRQSEFCIDHAREEAERLNVEVRAGRNPFPEWKGSSKTAWSVQDAIAHPGMVFRLDTTPDGKFDLDGRSVVACSGCGKVIKASGYMDAAVNELQRHMSFVHGIDVPVLPRSRAASKTAGTWIQGENPTHFIYDNPTGQSEMNGEIWERDGRWEWVIRRLYDDSTVDNGRVESAEAARYMVEMRAEGQRKTAALPSAGDTCPWCFKGTLEVSPVDPSRVLCKVCWRSTFNPDVPRTGETYVLYYRNPMANSFGSHKNAMAWNFATLDEVAYFLDKNLVDVVMLKKVQGDLPLGAVEGQYWAFGEGVGAEPGEEVWPLPSRRGSRKQGALNWTGQSGTAYTLQINPVSWSGGVTVYTYSLICAEHGELSDLGASYGDYMTAQAGASRRMDGHERMDHRVTTASKRALNDISAPAEIDTLRDEFCPVCGEADSFDGDQCRVCQYIRPPEEFMEPDLEKAKQIDLRQDQAGEQIGEDGLPVEDENANPFTEGEDEASANPFTEDQDEEELPPEDVEPAADEEPPLEGEEEPPDEEDDDEDEDEAEDEDDEDGKDDNAPPFLKKKKKSRQARRADTGGAQIMGHTLRLLANQERRIKELEKGLAFMASLAGVDEVPRLARIMKAAEEENPANAGWALDGTPAAETAEFTTEETLGDVNADAPGGGNATDDVAAIGETSESDVAPDAQTSVTDTGTVLDEPLDLNEQDVTAPVAGTETLGEGERGNAGTNRTETEVRIGDPNKPDAAFTETGWTEASRETRFMASLRLARLRLAFGTAQGEDLVIANDIAHSQTTAKEIAAEIATLESVVAAQRKGQKTQRPRNLVPRSKVTGQRAPSLRSDDSYEVPIQTVAASVTEDEVAFE